MTISFASPTTPTKSMFPTNLVENVEVSSPGSRVGGQIADPVGDFPVATSAIVTSSRISGSLARRAIQTSWSAAAAPW